jgi:hypothetical protein
MRTSRSVIRMQIFTPQSCHILAKRIVCLDDASLAGRSVFREMQISYRRRVRSRGVSATTVGANAKLLRKAHQISRRFFWAIFDSRSATPAATAITETGIETSVAKPTVRTYGASLLSVGHQSLKPQQIPANTPRIDALISHPAPSFDRAVASAVISARKISGVFHTGRSRLGQIITGHQHNAEPAATITMSSVFL